MDQSNDKTFTPATAAKHAKCGRSSIMRALQNKELLGERDNRNRWKISQKALEKWMKIRPDTDRTSPRVTKDTDQDSDQIKIRSDLAAARATIEELRSQITRDDERHANEIKRLEKIIDQLTTPSPSLIERIFSHRK